MKVFILGSLARGASLGLGDSEVGLDGGGGGEVDSVPYEGVLD